MATPKWNKERKLWIIQAQHNGLKKTFYSSTPGLKGKREVMDKCDDWIEFGGSQKVTVEKCVELYLKDIEARLGRRDTYRQTEIYTRLYVLPALSKCKMNNLTLRDWQSVLNEARRQKRHDAPTFKVMLLCGLRPGECLGLQEGDIGDHVLHIRRAVNDDGEITQGKNQNAKRDIPLPPLAESIILDTLKRNHARNFGTPWIFCNYYGGPACQDSVRKQWNKLKAERDLPGTLYSLRHTFVSIVSSQTHLAEGTIKTLIGHSESMDTFGTYKHEVSGELERAAEVINLTFERLKSVEN